jgi:protein-tyrosine phosphatase
MSDIAPSSARPIRVLFVCLGNICRSPMAEAVFRHKVQAAGLSARIEADSAGTGDWHAGAAPHHGTQRVLREEGISTAGMTARQIRRSDLNDFDYVLTMDDDNLATVRGLGEGGRAVVRPLMEYAPNVGVAEVPDPFYHGGFEGVYQLIDAACDGLLAAVRRDHAI